MFKKQSNNVLNDPLIVIIYKLARVNLALKQLTVACTHAYNKYYYACSDIKIL